LLLVERELYVYSLTILNATQSSQLVKNVNSTLENAGAKTSFYTLGMVLDLPVLS
jgi:hypothetical protein